MKSGTIFTKEPLAKNEVERTYRSFKTEEEGKECKYDWAILANSNVARKSKKKIYQDS